MHLVVYTTAVAESAESLSCGVAEVSFRMTYIYVIKQKRVIIYHIAEKS